MSIFGYLANIYKKTFLKCNPYKIIIATADDIFCNNFLILCSNRQVKTNETYWKIKYFSFDSCNILIFIDLAVDCN